MQNLVQEFEGQELVLDSTHYDDATMKHPCHDVTFPAAQVAEADRVEIWMSSFPPAGKPDLEIFRLMKGEGKCIAEIRKDRNPGSNP